METNLKESIIKICEENGYSNVKGSNAKMSIKSLLGRDKQSTDALREFWSNPEKALGPYEMLPLSCREALARAVYFHIQEANLLSSSLLRNLGYGLIFKFGGALIHKGWRIKQRGPGWTASPLIALGRNVIHACRVFARLFLRVFRFTALYSGPYLHFLWKYARVDPWILAHRYIKHIPVDPQLSPVFQSIKPRVMSCALVGIDFLPSNGKLYFLEGNFNAGHYMERHWLSPQGDTVAVHLVDWAIRSGFARIVFFASNFEKSFDRDLEKAWQTIANKSGVRLEVVDDPFIGSPWPRSRNVFMDARCDDTVYVNGRYLNSPLSRLISQKGLMEQEIKRFNDSAPLSREIPIPKLIRSNQEIFPVDDGSRFPNIIVKNAYLDQTKGISLYKTRKLPDNATQWPSIAYEYVVPTLVVKRNESREEEYVHIFRVYLLVTPDGPAYLGARKDVSSVAIPKALSFGIINDKSPYITNLHLGAYSVAHSGTEDQACKDAVLSIGTVVFKFLREKHLLTLKE